MTVNPALVSEAVYLCQSTDLVDSGLAVSFEVRYFSRDCHAFAVRYGGRVYAYLNQCAHVPMEMDYQPNQFFDSTGHWLMCATHGAMYAPTTGHCHMGPCRGGLLAIATSEADGVVHWHTSERFKAVFEP